MSVVAPAVLVKWLRAAGEPSRLRLLALCTEVALSVSDLAQALRQSEPRVSRHLRILCEAGLLERLPQGQWVHYRVSASAPAASFVRGLLAQLDARDHELQRDRAAARAASASEARDGAHGAESRLGRALAGFVAAGGLGTSVDAVLVVGVAHPELLETAAQVARHCTALAPSRRAAQGARAFAERRGFACRVLQAPSGPGGSDLTRAGSSFEALLLDHPAAGGEALGEVLAAARGVVVPGGRLWIFEPYEALESSRERVVEHPLARLRRLLGAAGFVCERLSPLEADGEHVLAAVARAAADPRAALSAHGVSA
ncbi:MAG TPA: metalloregulator ArsR/SmtB family transcription factor [Steroidobacteraceae bacterium]|nr:metalloregulator ArsR/SmtB family transcription factor [Steroidobacteraceae bacterium]